MGHRHFYSPWHCQDSDYPHEIRLDQVSLGKRPGTESILILGKKILQKKKVQKAHPGRRIDDSEATKNRSFC